MAKGKKKIIVGGEEVDLSKIKSIKFTLDVEIPKKQFDELLRAMSTKVEDDKTRKDEK